MRRRADLGCARRASDASSDANAFVVSGESVGAAITGAALEACGGEELGELEEEEEDDIRGGYDAGERCTRGRTAALLRTTCCTSFVGEQSASSSSDSDEALALPLALALSLSASCTKIPR